MLEKLTPEQERIIIECRDEWLHRGLKENSFNMEEFRKGINWLYDKCGFGPPHIIVTDSPMAAQSAANIIMENNFSIEKMQEEVDKRIDLKKKVPLQNFTPYGSLSDYGWASFYDAMERIGVDLGPKKEEFHIFMNFLKAGHYDFIALESVVIVCMKPQFIKQVEGRNHATDGPAIAWKDGYKLYAINGRTMPAWVFEDEITKDKFIKETNAELRAGMYARLGQAAVMKLLGAELVDTCTDNDEVLKLWKTKEKFPELRDQHLTWVECACPSTGTSYLLGCDPSATTAKAAMAASWGMQAEEYTVDDHT